VGRRRGGDKEAGDSPVLEGVSVEAIGRQGIPRR
jgi:hypothetical protein